MNDNNNHQRMCAEMDCQEPAGSDYNPAWCPKHGKEQAESMARRLKILNDSTCVICGKKAGFKKQPGMRLADCNECGNTYSLGSYIETVGPECVAMETDFEYLRKKYLDSKKVKDYATDRH